MKQKELEGFHYLCKEMLVSKMLDFVRENGEDVTDYDRNEFGLEDEDGCKITKVLNLVDDGGCYFALPNSTNIDVDYECEDVLDLELNIEGRYTFYAVQCLYIEENAFGEEHLMSYSLYNGGLRFLDDLSDPDHASMLNDSLEYVSMVANVLMSK